MINSAVTEYIPSSFPIPSLKTSGSFVFQLLCKHLKYLKFKLVCDLSIGAISNDLERTLTLFQGQAILWR